MTITGLTSDQRMESIARAITERLSESTAQLPHDISERLRVARMQAVSRRRVESLQAAPAVAILGGSMAINLGGSDGGIWNRLTSVLALVALIAGLIGIAHVQDDRRAHELAEVDAELLTDDLPPAAYTDPGFAQFLRANPSN